MRPLRKVAVLIETSRETGRELLRGVRRFYQEKPNWSVYFRQHHLGAPPPRWIKKWRGDGILSRVNDKRTAKELIKTRIPMIDLRGGAHAFGFPLFGTNEISVAEHAYEHLSACGLSHFAFVGEPTGEHVYDDERRDSFVKILRERGSKCFVFTQRLSGSSERSWDAHQAQLAVWLSKLPKPIGVLCCHDDRGQQVLDACQRAGLHVPDEVAVLGVDNDEFLCRLATPSLSSIDIGSEQIGYQAAALLDRLMNGDAKFENSVLFDVVGVVKRQSTDIIACDDPEIARALRFIREHACNQVSVYDVERHIGISRTVLNRRFKKVIGHPPKQEILRVQMEEGRRLLLTTSNTIQSISEQCGFNEAWYFTAVFKKFTGITPGAFRAKQGRDVRNSN
jgi:LacI family transcriptional regulator